MYKRLSHKEKVHYTILYFIFLIFVIWGAVLFAPSFSAEKFGDVLVGINQSLDNPTDIIICDDTGKCVAFAVFVYSLGYFIIISNLKNKRFGVEQGSAMWGDTTTLRRKYTNKEFLNNLIISKDFRVSLSRLKGRFNNLPNLNTVIIGGPGSGKTRGHVIPNVLNAKFSFICCDPKGTTAKMTGAFLKLKGFVVKVLDLKNPSKSWGYNPFHYFRSEDDVMKTVTNLFKSTTPKGSSTQDPYWDNMAQEYILGLSLFLWKYAPPEEQNFPMVIDCIRHDQVVEDDPYFVSDMQLLMNEIEQENPDDLAVQYYKDVHNGACKTVQSIQSTAISHMAKYSLESIRNMSEVDELDLKHLADKKTALFLLIPDNDTSFNFIPAMLYIQAFQQLYDRAEEEKNDALPMHLHFYMDEFANVALPDEFLTILATCRSRNIGIDIILQNLSQLKGIYKEGWENIVGQCSILKYLGGLEKSTHEYVSQMLGKETICTNSYGRSRGRNGNYTTNDQVSARDLMTPDEVRTMPSNKCIVFVQGENAIFDDKFDVTMHPNYQYSGYVTKEEFDHGKINSIARIEKSNESINSENNFDDLDIANNEYFVYSNEQIEKILDKSV